MSIYLFIYLSLSPFLTGQVRKVDDKDNSAFKHDRFLMFLQVFKTYTATIMFYIFDTV